VDSSHLAPCKVAFRWRLANQSSTDPFTCDSARAESGLNRHLKNLVGGVTGSFVDPLDCFCVRRLGQAEHPAGFRVGPSVLEIDTLFVLDVEIRLMGFRQLFGCDSAVAMLMASGIAAQTTPALVAPKLTITKSLLACGVTTVPAAIESAGQVKFLVDRMCQNVAASVETQSQRDSTVPVIP
jgi:hypothetical protein